MNELITYKEACKVLNTSKSSFYKYVSLGHIPKGANICGVMQWLKQDILDYRDKQIAKAKEAA